MSAKVCLAGGIVGSVGSVGDSKSLLVGRFSGICM